MKKTLLSLITLAFIASAPTVFAAAHTNKPADDKDKVMMACKDKKPGDMVKVGDKDMKCPKKDAKK